MVSSTWSLHHVERWTKNLKFLFGAICQMWVSHFETEVSCLLNQSTNHQYVVTECIRTITSEIYSHFMEFSVRLWTSRVLQFEIFIPEHATLLSCLFCLLQQVDSQETNATFTNSTYNHTTTTPGILSSPTHSSMGAAVSLKAGGLTVLTPVIMAAFFLKPYC